MVIPDGSQLPYNGHDRKPDRLPLPQRTERGYERHSALLVSDRDGDPLAPVFQGRRAADGVPRRPSGRVEPPLLQLDALAPGRAFVDQLGWAKPRAHVIDAEADALGHCRHGQRAGYTFLVRADSTGRVRHRGAVGALEPVRPQRRRRQAFRPTRAVAYHGRKA